MAFSASSSTEDVSLKLRSRDLRQARETTQQLESESRKMEVRLQELKMAMNREKEERERNQGGFWRTGQVGSLSSYGREAVHKAATQPKAKDKKKKVKVLKDEPVAVPERSKAPGTMGYLAQRGGSGGKENRIKGPRCGQCEEKAAHVSCLECGEDYCANCFASFHLKGALKKHRSLPVGANGARTPRGVPSKSDLEKKPSPSSDKSQSQIVKITEETNPMKVTLSDIDFAFAQDALKNGHPAPDEIVPQPGPSLLDGNYNEADSAAAFQEALREWRGGGGVKAGQGASQKPVSPVRSPVVSTESGTNTGVPRGASPLDIHFKQSLTYAEKLMLKRHRRTQLGTLPDEIQDRRLAASLCDYDEDFDPELLPDADKAVDFESMYVAMGLPQPTVQASEDSQDRPESRVSIVEVDPKPSRHKIKGVEESRSYQVTEVPGEDLPSSAQPTARKAKNDRASSGPPRKREAFITPTPRSASKKPTSASSTHRSSVSQSLQGHKEGHDKEMCSEEKDAKGAQIKVQPTARPQSRAKSRPGSLAARPESRAKSRAETRKELFGEGTLTKVPSDALHQVANLASVVDKPVYEPYKADLGGFFTVGVTQLPQDTPRTITPSKHKNNVTEQKWVISNKLYKMGPRSWRPESSLGVTVSQTEAESHLETVGIQDYRDIVSRQEVDAVENNVYMISGNGDSRLWSQHASEVETKDQTTPLPVLPVMPSDLSPRQFSPSAPSTPKPAKSVRNPRRRTTPPPPQPSSRAASRSGRESVMIVVDGDDMSQYDHEGERKQQDDEDVHTMKQLEWELASHAESDDGKASRLSMLSAGLQESCDLDLEDDEGRTPTPTEQPQYDLDQKLRESVLMNDFEEMEAKFMNEDLDDVKALH